ncbi:cation-transporting P-type ATPase [Myxococcus sp. K15C18031901]|uniref:cation-translocating P-type ATPase n=1 Tax=Myxococcus dinghuensis TaxID=2906761 RepID=UPI0020A6FECF|nr:cation-transporting P-type ATPase [Myxococcus dinghuensis]MCP3103244.1 cation-transporting P-type ATPase [Myxococcus dinghuensis]
MVVILIDGQASPAKVVRHAVASRRLRLAVPGLLGNRYMGRRLERTLHAWPGVEEVKAEPRSGRLLLRYGPEAPLLERLEEEGEDVSSEAPAAHEPPPRRPQAPAQPPPDEEPWHARTVDEVLRRCRTDRQGLSRAEAAARLKRHGANVVNGCPPRSRWSLLRAQVATVPMGLLMGSAAASALAGDVLESTAILAVVGLNAGIGYRIERRNEALLASWQRLEAGQAQVLRDGVLQDVPASDLVVGDVLLVRAGDVLPADARVLESHRLSVDEAPLTGESEPQPKGADPVAEDAPLAERHAMLYAGTAVSSGHGRAVIVATGSAMALARVRKLVEETVAPPTPMSRKLDRLDRRVALFSVGATVLSGAVGLAHGRPLAQVLRGAVALGVAALPEGLPIVATAALVRSMQRLHARGMVVRRVASAEALGGVTVICADKTGTLTRNEMRLEVLDVGQGAVDLASLRARPDAVLEDAPSLALAAALLNSDVDVHRNGHEVIIAGSATERALVTAAHDAGLDGAQLRRAYPRRRLMERSEGIHYVVSLHEAPEGGVAFVKGAPEQIIRLCSRDANGPLDARSRERLLKRNQALAEDGLRVLALGWRRVDLSRDEARDADYTFIGFMGLRDPLREGAADTLRQARVAGIRTIILTGDQKHTAEAVARQVGLRGETLVAKEVTARLSSPGGAEGDWLERVSVLARVTPEDKMALVRALRARGEIVAMAGDGINDAPALKAADVGVAVGARSSDMARQMADVVMAGEDLRGIIHAVGEGRIVQDNLRRSIRFLFATNLSEMALVVGASLLNAREPLLPLQLLWLNLLTDTLPGLALALEPGDADILDRPPAPPDAPLLPGDMARQVVRDALLMAGLGAAGMVLGGPPLAFGMLTAAQLGYAPVCRAPRHIHGGGYQGSGRFTVLVGGAVAMQGLALVVPPLRAVLGLPAPTWRAFAGLATGLVLPMTVSGLYRQGRRVLRRAAPRASVLVPADLEMSP